MYLIKSQKHSKEKYNINLTRSGEAAYNAK